MPFDTRDTVSVTLCCMRYFTLGLMLIFLVATVYHSLQPDIPTKETVAPFKDSDLDISACASGI